VAVDSGGSDPTILSEYWMVRAVAKQLPLMESRFTGIHWLDSQKSSKILNLVLQIDFPRSSTLQYLEREREIDRDIYIIFGVYMSDHVSLQEDLSHRSWLPLVLKTMKTCPISMRIGHC
jgi:hypothetical protein